MRISIEKFDDLVQVSGDGSTITIPASIYENATGADLLSLLRVERELAAEVFTGE